MENLTFTPMPVDTKNRPNAPVPATPWCHRYWNATRTARNNPQVDAKELKASTWRLNTPNPNVIELRGGTPAKLWSLDQAVGISVFSVWKNVKVGLMVQRMST